MAVLEMAMLQLMVVASLCSGIPLGVIPVAEEQTTVSPEMKSPPVSLWSLPYNTSEVECFKQNKVLFTDGNCHSLRYRGPCPRGYWLVLSQNHITHNDESTRSFPECQEIPCHRSLTAYWSKFGGCKHVRRDMNVTCPYAGNRIGINEYGQGECTCLDNHARWVEDGKDKPCLWEGDCHPLYSQGPCDKDQIFQTALSGNLIVGRCVANPCNHSTSQKTRRAYARLTPESLCYELGQIGGPCTDNETFALHPLSKEPRCLQRYPRYNPFDIPVTKTDFPLENEIENKELELLKTHVMSKLDGSYPPKRRQC